MSYFWKIIALLTLTPKTVFIVSTSNYFFISYSFQDLNVIQFKEIHSGMIYVYHNAFKIMYTDFYSGIVLCVLYVYNNIGYRFTINVLNSTAVWYFFN